MARPTEGDLDPGPADPSTVPPGRPAVPAGLLGAEVAGGLDLPEAAARMGATVALAHGGQGPAGSDAVAVAEAFTAAERALGGGFHLVALRRCGPGPPTPAGGRGGTASGGPTGTAPR